MFGSIGGPELLLVFVLALLLFGPRKLPEIGKAIGKTLAEFKRATNDFHSSLEREIELEKLRELKADLKNPLPSLDVARGEESRAALPVGTIAQESGTEPSGGVENAPGDRARPPSIPDAG